VAETAQKRSFAHAIRLDSRLIKNTRMNRTSAPFGNKVGHASALRLVLPHTIYLTLCLLLCGCSSLFSPGTNVPAQREQTQLDLSIEAAAGLNPDAKGRGAPILLRIYELRSDVLFQEADYFSLQNADRATLGADLLAVDQFILRPGETRSIRRKSHPEATAIGVFAGYQDLPNATWRSVYKMAPAPEQGWMRMVVPANKAELRIDLQANAILLTDRATGQRPIARTSEQPTASTTRPASGVMDQFDSARKSMPDAAGLSDAVKSPLEGAKQLFKP